MDIKCDGIKHDLIISFDDSIIQSNGYFYNVFTVILRGRNSEQNRYE